MRRSKLHVGLVASVALVLAACGSTAAPSASSSAGGDAGGGDLTVGSVEIPESPFPPDSNYGWGMMMLAYDRLVDVWADGSVTPSAAESWENIDDTTVRFHLRDDLTFNDGSPVRADDAAAFFNYVVENDSAIRNRFPMVTGAEVVDDLTMDLILESPSSNILNFLGWSAIISKEHLDEVGPEGYATDPLGSGPYEITSHRPLIDMVFERVAEEHPIASGAYDTITIQAISESSTALSAVRNGSIAAYTGSIEPEFFESLESDGFTVTAEPSALTAFVLSVPDACASEAPTCDVNVRHALNLAVDRETLANTFYGGHAVAVSQPALPGLPGYNDDIPLAFDPDEAERILDEAGFERGADGTRFSMKIGMQTPGETHRMVLAVAEMFGAIGVPTEVELFESGYFVDNFLDEEANPDRAFNLGFSGGVVQSTSSGVNIAFVNRIGPGARWDYENPDFLELVPEVEAETDPARAEELMHELMLILVEDPPVIPLLGVGEPTITSPDLSGVTIDFPGSGLYYRSLAPAGS